MKLIICVVILILLIVYYNNNSKCLNEKFTPFDNFISLFTPNDIKKAGPFFINGNMKGPEPNDPKMFNLYNDKYWVMKSNDFSDIFNNDNTNICSAINVDPQFSNMIFGCDPSVKPDNIPSNTVTPYDLSKFTPAPTTPGPTTQPGFLPSDPIAATIVAQPLPTGMKTKFPLEIADETTSYVLLGYAINEYYNQYYLIYETEVIDPSTNKEAKNNPSFMKVKLYKYALVRMKKNVPHIIHKVGVREKIKMGDFVYLSYGVFQLGPFRISKIQ